MLLPHTVCVCVFVIDLFLVAVSSEVEETLEELNSRVASRMADAAGGPIRTPSAKDRDRIKRDDPSASTRIPGNPKQQGSILVLLYLCACSGESTIAVSMIESMVEHVITLT